MPPPPTVPLVSLQGALLATPPPPPGKRTSSPDLRGLGGWRIFLIQHHVVLHGEAERESRFLAKALRCGHLYLCFFLNLHTRGLASGLWGRLHVEWRG